MNIVIPRTIEQAKETLNGIGGLLTAKEWERAAIVYAFTKDPGKPGPKSRNRIASDAVSDREFAALNIAGLRGANTVWAYRKVWAEAMKDGAVEAAPGKTITLPSRDWPGTKTGATEGNTGNVVAAIKRNPKVLAEALRAVATDEHIEQVTEALAEAQTDPLIREKVAEKVAVKTAHIPHHTKKPGTDWAKVARAVVMNHSRADTELDNLVTSLQSNSIYTSQIEEVITHLRRDLTDTPQRIADLTALIDGEQSEAPRSIKNVTPVKELA